MAMLAPVDHSADGSADRSKARSPMPLASTADPVAASQTCEMQFAVEGVTCPACMRTIETGLEDIPGLTTARFNLTKHRLQVTGVAGVLEPGPIMARLDRLGYRARPIEATATLEPEALAERGLIRALAVSGFAAANIMLLSVSVWSGNATGIDPEMRDLFHWVSAIIAVPAVAIAGQPFFQSAFSVLRRGRTNMDVPISLGVLLALGMSILETSHSGEHAYFDSAVMLLFFLLIGRTLDMRSRRQTRNLGANLLALQKPTVTRLSETGAEQDVPVGDIRPGDRVLIPAGQRIGVDGRILEGETAIDMSLITGESAPAAVGPGGLVYAGTLNTGAAVIVEATARAGQTLLAEIAKLIDRASVARGQFIQLADRAARLYAPVVHVLALGTFFGWLAAGQAWQPSLLVAITVLIITCPCALGLAVPVVRVVATGRLFRAGVLVNSGDALERLAGVDTVVFDKTGTLTVPEPELVNAASIAPADLALAARLALASHHPLARALTRHARGLEPIPGARELAGQGIVAEHDGETLRLGSRALVGAPDPAHTTGHSEIWFRKGDAAPIAFYMNQDLKADANTTIAALKAIGLTIVIVSGDRIPAVARAATALGVTDWHGEVNPAQKIAIIEGLRAEGRNVLMVGDGLNDAAALQAAHVSAAPASAMDITQAAADLIVVGTRLMPLVGAIETARKARRLMVQNIRGSIGYNIIAVPMAMAGLVTPLIAALYMSGSSIVVTLNAMRANSGR